MSWFFLNTGKDVLNHTSKIQAFLMEQEPFCVATCYRFLNFNATRDCIWIHYNKKNEKPDTMLLLSGRVLYPVFDIDTPAMTDLYPILHRFHTGSRKMRSAAPVFSVQGSSDAVKTVQYALERLSYPDAENIDYDLMTLKGHIRPSPPRLDDVWVQLYEHKHRDRKLLEALYPLQADYEKEEVVPQGGSFSAASCRMGLERLLKNQVLAAASHEGTLIAKANSNAFGYTRAQIGGVYVLPSYRGNGIAAFLVHTLCTELENRNYVPSLFVRNNNTPARRAYIHVGFEHIADYRIAYYTG